MAGAVQGIMYQGRMVPMEEYYRLTAAAKPAPAGGTTTTTGPDGRTASTSVGTVQTQRYNSGAQSGHQTQITQPAFENQQQTQLEASLAAQQQKAQIEAENAQQQAAQQQRERELEMKARLQADAEARRLGYISTVQGQAPATVQHGTSIGGNENAARSAAFARAKEQAGQTALASVQALQSVMEDRGGMSSSLEADGMTDIVGGARAGVNEFTRDQLISDLGRASDIADMEYEGGIAQRGQDLSRIPSLLAMITASGGIY